MIVSKFSKLCICYHNPVLEHFYHNKKSLTLMYSQPHPTPPAPDATDPNPDYRAFLLFHAASSVRSLEKTTSSLKAWVVIFVFKFFFPSLSTTVRA